MKTFILSTLAAAALALSAGSAFASRDSDDHGFDIYLQSVEKAPAAQRQFLFGERRFLSGETIYAPSETAPLNHQTDRSLH